MSRPLSRPLNLREHEVTALQIVLEDYLKDRQPTAALSKIGVISISSILNKVRGLK